MKTWQSPFTGCVFWEDVFEGNSLIGAISIKFG